MTTIACDGKSMAGDSLITGGGERVGWFEKVRQARDGRLFGACGGTADCIRFARWINGEAGPSDIKDDKFEALVLNTDGTIDWYGQDLEPLRYFAPNDSRERRSDGSRRHACGQISRGRRENLACERDIHSGGEITALHLSRKSSKAPAPALP